MTDLKVSFRKRSLNMWYTHTWQNHVNYD